LGGELPPVSMLSPGVVWRRWSSLLCSARACAIRMPLRAGWWRLFAQRTDGNACRARRHAPGPARHVRQSRRL